MKAIIIMFRNFVGHTHSLIIRPKNEEDWSMLSNLQYGLTRAIEWLGEINTMDWCSIHSTDLLGREQIKVTCSNGRKSYNFYLTYSLSLSRVLGRIINNMKTSKIIGLDNKVKIGDEVDEYCHCDIASMYPISSFKPFSGKNAKAIVRLSEMDDMRASSLMPKATKCIFNGPATIVFWDDGTKTVVKCQNEDEDVYSEEAGVALCFMKKMLGNKSNFNNTLNELVDDGIERQYQELKKASLKLYTNKRK